MSINILYLNNLPLSPGERVKRVRNRWEKSFITNSESELQLVVGYIYALAILLTDDSGIIITDRDNKKTNKPLQLPSLRTLMIGVGLDPPKINESLAEYIKRAGVRPFTKKYLLIISPKGNNGPVDCIQFDHLTFLQGFLSVLAALDQPYDKYIIAIYDNTGVKYNWYWI